ncbi:hypothetical protein V1525DRAFT_393821 [Lipomyces kononenkoae]|uniref:Uncharacterized protein n=1 Tax=Lipomyces kononenkoae TaxID=34357 RepID=A0ACC3TBY1_LIPKO
MTSDDEDDDGSLRACDSCRLKKIRCDKKDPCGSCSSRHLQCLRTMPDARKRKRRNSASLPSDVQARLDNMQSQLDKIMSALSATRATATPYSPPRPEHEFVSVTSQSTSPASLPSSYYSALLAGPESIAKYLSIVSSLGERTPESQSNALAGNFASVRVLNSLVTNIKGQLQHLGKSSLLSMSIEAQLLTTALQEERDKSDETDCITPVTDLEYEADYEKNGITMSDTVTQQQRTDIGMRDARGNLEDVQHKDTDIVAPQCPVMKAVLDASLDYVASNFLPVDWVEELDIRDHVPVLPSKKLGQEFIDYYTEFILPFEQKCSPAFVKMLRDDIYRPQIPDRLQKVVCASYVMAIVLFWPERELQEGDISLRVQMLKNIWLILKEPSVFITANCINVQTLLLAATAAERIHHPGLCWTLISQCSRLALTLGLHRQSAIYFERELSPAQIDERRSLFWRCYFTEKSLSLTLGRTSSLPMYDCDVQRRRNAREDDVQETQAMPSFINDAEYLERHRFGTTLIDAYESFAEVYDAVYVRLYSARAQQQSACDKRRAVRELDSMLRSVWQDFHPWVIESRLSDNRLYHAMTAQAEFMYYVCMTMIHRLSKGIPDSESGVNAGLIDTPDGWQQSTDIALASARRAILVIHEALSLPGYERYTACLASWSLIFQPFAPFFELFTSVIKTGHRDDLRLMTLIVGILRKLQLPPESVRKLTHVAELFTRLANIVVLAMERKVGSSQKSSIAHTSTAGTALPTSFSKSRPSNGATSSKVVADGLTTPIESPPNPTASTSLSRQTSVSTPAAQFPFSYGTLSDASYQQPCTNSSKPVPPSVPDHEIETLLLGGSIMQDVSSIKSLLWEANLNPLDPPDLDWTTFDTTLFAPVDYAISQVNQQPSNNNAAVLEHMHSGA